VLALRILCPFSFLFRCCELVKIFSGTQIAGNDSNDGRFVLSYVFANRASFLSLSERSGEKKADNKVSSILEAVKMHRPTHIYNQMLDLNI